MSHFRDISHPYEPASFEVGPAAMGTPSSQTSNCEHRKPEELAR